MVPDPDGDYLQPGTLIDGKYEVRRLLGQGGMGAVVEANHLLRQARVALKFMSPEVLRIPGVVERFLNEGVAASRINNEHVVKVLDVSKLPSGQPYLVMEYLDGEDMESLLQREGPNGLPDVARAVHLILQVLRGLQVAHHVGIIHRDLKPANCFVVNHDGEPDFIKIVDFGISKVQQAEGELRLTHEGSTMGTPLYVSLEQAKDASDVDARSDVYSVAVILYELLCGHTPFVPTNMAELFIHLAITQPRSLDELRVLPHGLAAVVHKGLEKDRADRYQSVGEFAAALAPYADERSDLVIRQMQQRGGSNRPSWTPSVAPVRTQTKSGTLIAGSVRPKSIPAGSSTEPGTPPPPPPREDVRATAAPSGLNKLRWPIGALVLAGGMVGTWFMAKGESAAPTQPTASAASRLTDTPTPHPEARGDQATLQPSSAPNAQNSGLGEGSSASASSSAHEARDNTPVAENAGPKPGTPAAGSSPALAGSARRQTDPRPGVAPTRSRPELKQIGIED